MSFLDKQGNLLALLVNNNDVWFYEIEDCNIYKSTEFAIPDHQILDFKIDGNHAVARVRNSTNGIYSLVFYQLNGTSLSQVAEFFAQDNSTDDYGVGLHLKNDLAIAVSRTEGGYGALYIYELKNGVWKLEERITAPATELYDQGDRAFGRAVAFDGRNIFVGAPVVGGSSNQGKVFRYRKVRNLVGPDYWSQGIYTGDNGEKNYGSKIASNGTQLIITGSDSEGPVLHPYSINSYGTILSESNSGLNLASTRFVSGDIYLSENSLFCSLGKTGSSGRVADEIFVYSLNQLFRGLFTCKIKCPHLPD